MLTSKGSPTKNVIRVVCGDIREENPEYSSITLHNLTIYSDRRLSVGHFDLATDRSWPVALPRTADEYSRPLCDGGD